MSDRPRLAAVAFVLLTQVLGSFAVLCDEGRGRQVVELLPEGCCDETDVRELGSCGGCEDSQLIQLVQRPDELWEGYELPPLAIVAIPGEALLQSPLVLPMPPRPAAAGDPAQALTGTVVLRC